MSTKIELGSGFDGARRPSLNVPSGSKILMGSNTPVKRRDAAAAFQHFGADITLKYIKDYLPVLPNAAEDTGVGEGNVRQKTVNAHEALTNVGFSDDKSFVYNTDIVIEFEQPELHEHPFLEDYKHLYIEGQRFPGTEMAPMALVNGFETLMYDINRALDDIEQTNGYVDRGVQIQTVGQFTRVGEPEKIFTVAGRREYQMLAHPLPYAGEESLGIYDLDYYLAFPETPEESVQSQKDALGLNCHPDSHNARAVKNLIEALKIPKKSAAKLEFSGPKIIMHPKQLRGSDEPAFVITDRHFTGSWGRFAGDPAEEWIKRQQSGLERHRYHLIDDPDFLDTEMPFHQQDFLPDGPSTDITCMIEFMRKVDSVVFLPFRPTGNVIEDTRQRLMRDMLFNMRRDLHNLGDGHVKGRPDVVMDGDLVQRHLHLLRIGTTAMRIGSAFQMPKKGEALHEVLHRGWEDHEYVMTPFEPMDGNEKAVVPVFEQRAAAFLGNATSENPDVLNISYDIARLHYLNGFAGSEGHGGKGSMNMFARAAVDLYHENIEVNRRGITTPIATLEGDPDGAIEAGFIPIREPHMSYRIPGIIAPDIDRVIVDKGGPGTQTEWNYAALDNLNRVVNGLEPRTIVVNNAPNRFKNMSVRNYQNLEREYTREQLALTNSALVRGGAEDMFRVAEDMDLRALVTHDLVLKATASR